MIEAVSSIKAIRAASIVFDQHLRLSGIADKILCKAEIKIACTDHTMTARALPKSTSLEMIRRLLP